MRKRRFYVFNNPEIVREHIAKVLTVSDVLQLSVDVLASGCNLVKFGSGIRGVWILDYSEGLGPFKRHIFVLKSLGIVPSADECDSYTVLEE